MTVALHGMLVEIEAQRTIFFVGVVTEHASDSAGLPFDSEDSASVSNSSTTAFGSIE